MEIYLVIGAVLTALCAWLGSQVYRLQTTLKEVGATLEGRTTELESAQLQLQRLSTEDGLTALANHEQFLEFVEREWRRARRDGLPVSLVFLDIDHFRSYNRQYGRPAGDECLKQVGRALEGLAARASDLIARYHRDEFAVILSATDGAGAMRVAERIRQCVEALEIPAARDAAMPVVTVSVSVASAVPQRESAWEELDLIKAARHALRQARSAGGNRVSEARLGVVSLPEVVAAIE